MKKILEIIKNKWLRETSFTIILIAIVILVYLAINLGVKALDITDIDLTQEKFYSLSEESKNQIKDIDKEINIYMFGYEENSMKVDLAKQYSKYKDNIKVQILSMSDRPDLVQQFNLSSSNGETPTIVFECEGRNIKASDYDLYTYDYTNGEYIDLTEQKMTNSILGVTLENAPKVYFLTGHSEYGLNEYFQVLQDSLKSETNEVKTLDLLVDNKIPEDCSTLVIASPSTDFTDYETNLIKEYVNKGGDILWLSDYSKNGVLANAQKILDLYGVSITNNGIILEQDPTKMLMQTQDLILPTINTESEITSAFASSGKVLFIDSGKIEIKEEEKLEELGVTVTELLTTSPDAFYRTDLSDTSSTPTSSENKQSYIVGALASKTIIDEESEEGSVDSNLVIYANSLFATDYPMQIQNQVASAIYFYNNEDLILNSISYLNDRTDAITIRKTYSSLSYAPTEAEDLVVKVVIFIIPLVIIALGITVWIVRKRRK